MCLKDKKKKLMKLKSSLNDLVDNGIIEGQDELKTKISNLETQIKDDVNHSHYRRNRFKRGVN